MSDPHHPAAAPGPASGGAPEVVDAGSWQEARDALLVREKAHTREEDAIAAARRRLPMTAVDGDTPVTGADGAVPFRDLFQGRQELITYQHMWWDGAPHQGQCEGCTMTAVHLPEPDYLHARGVSLAILTSGPWEEVDPFVGFMGYTTPWYSVRDAPEPIGGRMGHLSCFLRRGDDVFLTYSTTGRGTERFDASLGLLDLTTYGRREGWQDDPQGWPPPIESGAPQGGHGAPISVFWRTDASGRPSWGPQSRPVPQWRRPGVTPADSLGREHSPPH